MKRLLIVGCSATKDPAAGLLPALDRYRGAYYQMIRQVPADELPEIVILSAELGFIRSDAMIPDYDRRLTKVRAAELLPGAPVQFADALRLGCYHYDEILVAAGWIYRQVIDVALDAMENKRGFPFYRRAHTTGGIGTQRGQLKLWLRGEML